MRNAGRTAWNEAVRVAGTGAYGVLSADGPGLRPPTRRQRAALGLPSEAFAQAGRRAKGYGRSGRTAHCGPPPVALAKGGPPAGERVTRLRAS